MAALALDHQYTYLQSSEYDAEKSLLRLATCGRDVEEHPYFFNGTLVNPQRTAKLLLGLMSVVQARFHVPPGMLARILAEADPVVTSSDDRLRFEGFSLCCGVYVRIDLHPESVTGESFGRGTTNVDFNPPMLSALSMIGSSEDVSFQIGSDQVEMTTDATTVVEKKVKLPYRWLKGFVEVQACQHRMKKILEISGPQAVRFLKSMPRMKTNRRETWIVAAGNGLRMSQVKPRAGAGVRVGGLERLRVLERFASQAKTLNIYSDELTGATGWELVFDDCRFHLVLSPEVWRGFSGEGQALESLVNSDWEKALPKVQAQLTWNPVIDISDLASRSGISKELARDALAALGARGVVGFDLGASSYFHRQMPFDISDVDMTQPRLKNARKLLEDKKINVQQNDNHGIEAVVRSGDVQHRVHLDDQATTCTCPWYAKYKNERGPCKHVLAVYLKIDKDAQNE